MLKIGKRELEALEEMFFMVELHIEFSIVLSLSDFYYCKGPVSSVRFFEVILHGLLLRCKHLRFFVWLRRVTLSRL